MSTIPERLEQLIAELGISQRELSRRAGLTEVHVGKIIRRLRDDPSRDLERETLIVLAKALEVSTHWLATGEGPRDAQAVPESTNPQYGNLEGWPEAEKAASDQYRGKPRWVFRDARKHSGLTPKVVDVEFVMSVVRHILENTSIEEQARRNAEDTERDIVRQEKIELGKIRNRADRKERQGSPANDTSQPDGELVLTPPVPKVKRTTTKKKPAGKSGK